MVARHASQDIDVPATALKQIAFTPNASVTLRFLGFNDDQQRELAVTSGTRYFFPIRRILSTTSNAVVLTCEVGSPFEG